MTDFSKELEVDEDIADALSCGAPIFETAHHLGVDRVEFARLVLRGVGLRNGRDPSTFVRDCHKWALDFKASI